MVDVTPKEVGLRRKEEAREGAPFAPKDEGELTKHFVLWLLEEWLPEQINLLLLPSFLLRSLPQSPQPLLFGNPGWVPSGTGGFVSGR